MNYFNNKYISYRKKDAIYKEEKNDDYFLEEKLVNLLRKNNISISTAESITGGMIGSSIVNIPGASDIYEEGYITYSNRIKNKILNVKEESLNKYTAVSKEVCKEMLVNLKKMTNTNSAIVVTGYAGPGENAGLVYIGVNLFNIYSINKYIFKESRNIIRKNTTIFALNELYNLIIKYEMANFKE